MLELILSDAILGSHFDWRQLPAKRTWRDATKNFSGKEGHGCAAPGSPHSPSPWSNGFLMGPPGRGQLAVYQNPTGASANIERRVADLEAELARTRQTLQLQQAELQRHDGQLTHLPPVDQQNAGHPSTLPGDCRASPTRPPRTT